MQINRSCSGSIFYGGCSLAFETVKSSIASALSALKTFGQILLSPCSSLFGRAKSTQTAEGPLASLVDDPLKLILGLVGPIAARVNKRFAGLIEEFQEPKWKSMKQKAPTDCFLASLIKEAETLSSFDAKISFLFKKLEKAAAPIVLQQSRSYPLNSLERLEYLQEAVKDQNFLIFFNAIEKEFVEARQYLATLTPPIGDRQQAKLLREWMHQNTNLLSSRYFGIDFINMAPKLTAIPEEVGLCTRLWKIIDLSQNSIRVIPDSIEKLHELEIIRLNRNQLKELPESIGRLRMLKTLDVRNNQIKEIPKSLWSGIFFSDFHVSGNPLRMADKIKLLPIQTKKALISLGKGIVSIAVDVFRFCKAIFPYLAGAAVIGGILWGIRYAVGRLLSALYGLLVASIPVMVAIGLIFILIKCLCR